RRRAARAGRRRSGLLHHPGGGRAGRGGRVAARRTVLPGAAALPRAAGHRLGQLRADGRGRAGGGGGGRRERGRRARPRGRRGGRGRRRAGRGRGAGRGRRAPRGGRSGRGLSQRLGADPVDRPRAGQLDRTGVGRVRLAQRGLVVVPRHQVGEDQAPGAGALRVLAGLPAGQVDVLGVVVVVVEGRLAQEQGGVGGQVDQLLAGGGVTAVGQGGAVVLQAEAERVDGVVAPGGAHRERADVPASRGELVEVEGLPHAGVGVEPVG